MARQAPQQTVEEEDHEQERGSGGRGINQVALVGRLARDPDVRTTEGGVARAWFVLAVARPYVARDGEREADFISIVAWRQLAGVVGEHLSKGRLIGVTGRLQVNLLDDGNGGRRSSAEVVADQIVFLDSPRRERNSEE
ncbi:MAG TPA: single-stranded DNA-binding protein [bacterium]